jgi:hypothetical protein
LTALERTRSTAVHEAPSRRGILRHGASRTARAACPRPPGGGHLSPSSVEGHLCRAAAPVSILGPIGTHEKKPDGSAGGWKCSAAICTKSSTPPMPAIATGGAPPPQLWTTRGFSAGGPVPVESSGTVVDAVRAERVLRVLGVLRAARPTAPSRRRISAGSTPTTARSSTPGPGAAASVLMATCGEGTRTAVRRCVQAHLQTPTGRRSHTRARRGIARAASAQFFQLIERRQRVRDRAVERVRAEIAA